MTDEFPGDSVFDSLDEVSAFFEQGSVGYSATRTPGEYDGLELRTTQWQVQPLDVHTVASSFFADRDRFPEGTADFDNALLMRGIDHEWHGREPLHGQCCPAEAVAAATR